MALQVRHAPYCASVEEATSGITWRCQVHPLEPAASSCRSRHVLTGLTRRPHQRLRPGSRDHLVAPSRWLVAGERAPLAACMSRAPPLLLGPGNPLSGHVASRYGRNSFILCVAGQLLGSSLFKKHSGGYCQVRLHALAHALCWIRCTASTPRMSPRPAALQWSF